jgi:hypothetical protein
VQTNALAYCYYAQEPPFLPCFANNDSQQASLLDCCSDKKLYVVRGDVRDKSLLKDLIKDVDFIFPLACLTGAPLCNKEPQGYTQLAKAEKKIFQLPKQN